MCWGYNGYGRVGDGTTTQRLTPVNVSGLATGVTGIATGGEHTCALNWQQGQVLGNELVWPARRRHHYLAQHTGGCGRPDQRRDCAGWPALAIPAR